MSEGEAPPLGTDRQGRRWDNSPEAVAARERIAAAKARGAAEGKFGRKIAEEEAQDRFERWIEDKFASGATPDSAGCERQGLLVMFYLSGHARDDRVRFLAAKELRTADPGSRQPGQGVTSVSDEFDRRMAQAEESGTG